jgi:hypothetical protein
MAHVIPGPDPFLIHTDDGDEQPSVRPNTILADSRPALERNPSSTMRLKMLPKVTVPGITDVSLFLPLPIVCLVFAP